MTDPLYALVYLSRNDIDASSETEMTREIDRILTVSRANNQPAGITGALMFNNGCFAQVLEGSHAAVQTTFERIQCDERHSDVSILSFEPVSERGFADWAMAYVGRDSKTAEQYSHISRQSGFDFSALQKANLYTVLSENMRDAERGNFGR